MFHWTHGSSDSTERKLAIHAIPDKYKDHGAEHLRRRLPDSFSGMNISTVSY